MDFEELKLTEFNSNKAIIYRINETIRRFHQQLHIGNYVGALIDLRVIYYEVIPKLDKNAERKAQKAKVEALIQTCSALVNSRFVRGASTPLNEKLLELFKEIQMSIDLVGMGMTDKENMGGL